MTIQGYRAEACGCSLGFSPRDDTLEFVDKEWGGLWLRTSGGDVRELMAGQ